VRKSSHSPVGNAAKEITLIQIRIRLNRHSLGSRLYAFAHIDSSSDFSKMGIERSFLHTRSNSYVKKEKEKRRGVPKKEKEQIVCSHLLAFAN
jgi:hypothetical protein